MPEQDPIEQRIDVSITAVIHRYRNRKQTAEQIKYCADYFARQIEAFQTALRKAERERDMLLHPDPDIRCDSEVGLLHAELAKQSEENKRLKQERDEARRDSERLGWLDSNPLSVAWATGYRSPSGWNHQSNGGYFGSDDLRAAIDAALAVSKAGSDVLK